MCARAPTRVLSKRGSLLSLLSRWRVRARAPRVCTMYIYVHVLCTTYACARAQRACVRACGGSACVRSCPPSSLLPLPSSLSSLLSARLSLLCARAHVRACVCLHRTEVYTGRAGGLHRPQRGCGWLWYRYIDIASTGPAVSHSCSLHAPQTTTSNQARIIPRNIHWTKGARTKEKVIESNYIRHTCCYIAILTLARTQKIIGNTHITSCVRDTVIVVLSNKEVLG